MKKQAVLMKQSVAPVQATEVGIIRRKLASFDVKQHEFRENFRQCAPFEFDSSLAEVYARIDNVMTVVHGLIVLITGDSTSVQHGSTKLNYDNVNTQTFFLSYCSG